MKFSILHPTRSRPEKSILVVQAWLDHAVTKDFEIIVSIDDDDPAKDHYFRIYERKPNVRLIIRPNRTAIEAINSAAVESKGDILIVVSDDTGVLSRWDERIGHVTDGKQDFVLKVYDGIQKWIVTMPIMDRTYYNRYGYVYNPVYDHMFCDTELSHVAEITGKLIFRNDILIPHNHYSVTKQPKDSVTVKNDATQLQGAKTYIKRFVQNFGLEGVNTWAIGSTDHVQWIRNNLNKYR